MPVQQGKSVLAAKLGNRLVQAQQEHKGREPEVGNPQLPAGIEGGIARLVDCHLGEFKEGQYKGQPYFMAAGIAISPKEHEGKQVAGGRTQLGPEPLCDTPTAAGKRKTFSQHYGYMRDVLLLLGFDIDNLQGTPQQIEEQIVAGMKMLCSKDRAPYFRFRTWKGKKQDVRQSGDGKFYLFNINDDGSLGSAVPGKGPYASLEMGKAANKFAGNDPRVQHEWNGACEAPEAETQANPQLAGVNEVTGGRVPPNGTASHPATTATPDEFNEFAGQEETATGTSAGTDVSELSLEELVAAANPPNNDKAAATRLTEIALEAGVTQEQINAAKSWEEVVALASGEEPAADPTPPAPTAPKEPEKDEIWAYHPINPKTKQPSEKPVNIQILAVDKAARTVTVKRQDTKTMVKNLSWDALKAV